MPGSVRRRPRGWGLSADAGSRPHTQVPNDRTRRPRSPQPGTRSRAPGSWGASRGARTAAGEAPAASLQLPGWPGRSRGTGRGSAAREWARAPPRASAAPSSPALATFLVTYSHPQKSPHWHREPGTVTGSLPGRADHHGPACSGARACTPVVSGCPGLGRLLRLRKKRHPALTNPRCRLQPSSELQTHVPTWPPSCPSTSKRSKDFLLTPPKPADHRAWTPSPSPTHVQSTSRCTGPARNPSGHLGPPQSSLGLTTARRHSPGQTWPGPRAPSSGGSFTEKQRRAPLLRPCRLSR